MGIHKMSKEAGLEVPIEFIQRKLDKLHAFDDDENEGKNPHHHGPGGGHGGLKKWFRILKAFVQKKDIKSKEIHEIATAAGF